MLDKDGLAIQDVKLPVYHFNAVGEFTALLFIKIEIGTGLPSQSTLVPILEMKEGYTQVFNEENQAWEHIVDHRYKTAYDINTKQELEIEYLGELKAEHTLLAPPSFDHEFIDGAWVITKEKQAELEAQEKQSEIDKLKGELNQLKQDLVFAQAMGDDISDIVARVEKARDELAGLQ